MMQPHAMTCDHEILRKSLHELLTDQQEEALARHLAECSCCQMELERLAGEQSDWSRISEALRSESQSALTREMHSDYAKPHEFSDEPLERDGPESEIDFAVEFLEPAISSESIGRLADIDILAVIGRGGMGIVLKGFQAELKRMVAVKVLAPHYAVSGAARRRFAREAQAAAAILHPNVMPILTVHSGGRLPYLVMPFLACESLQERVQNHGPLETVDILRIGLQTAEGLAAAHAQGIVHRDVKPANILLERGVNRVMLTDFGLARAIDDANLTRSGVIAGTPQYMSPEQARGEPLDTRSDLFSFGSVLYTMATGRPPFRAESTYGILRRITDDTPHPICEVNPQVPTWLALIVEKLLAKSPSDRFASAGDVIKLLEQCLAHTQQPTLIPLPEFCRRPRSFRWSRKLLYVGAGVVCAAVPLIAVLTYIARPVILHRQQMEAVTTDIEPSLSIVPPEVLWNSAAELIHDFDPDVTRLESNVVQDWGP